MFSKLAYSQNVLRSLVYSEEKRAGIVAPVLAGAGLVAGAHVVSKGLQKGKHYKTGFTPGLAETRTE